MVRLVGLVVTLLLAACGSQQKQQVQMGQIVVINSQTLTTGGSDTLRFGHLYEGETAVLPLQLRNDSDRPMVITSIERTCGCTIFECDNQPIMPGEIRPATLTFDARGTRGWQFKVLKIHFAQKIPPHRLFVEAEVE